LLDARVLSHAEQQQVVPGAGQRGADGIAVARGRGRGRLRTFGVFTDDRAAGVGSVEHRTGLQHGRHLIRRGRGGRDAGPRRLDGAVGELVQPIGDLQDVPVGGEALGREAGQQAGAGAAAQLKRELPAQVAPVVDARVQALAAERAGQVPGIAEQEQPPVGQLGDQSAVHPERGRPGNLVHPDPLADPPAEGRAHDAERAVSRQPFGLVLIEIPDEREPALARQRDE
jgi:hypothetical protein